MSYNPNVLLLTISKDLLTIPALVKDFDNSCPTDHPVVYAFFSAIGGIPINLSSDQNPWLTLHFTGWLMEVSIIAA